MTEDIVKYITDKLQSVSPNIKSVDLIARQNVKGYIVKNDKEAGLDDKQIGKAYVRFNGEFDHDYFFFERKFRSESTLELGESSKLRLVICHKIKDEKSYERFVVNALQGINFSSLTTSDESQIEIILQNSSTDKEKIFMSETMKDETEITWNTSINLLLVDFELRYVTSPCTDFKFDPNEC